MKDEKTMILAAYLTVGIALGFLVMGIFGSLIGAGFAWWLHKRGMKRK